MKAKKTRVPVYILAGGKSSRFGSDKARAVLEGEPLILRVKRMVEPVASSVNVVADQAGKYADLGLRTLVDDQPGLGPLTGLATALSDLCSTKWLMLCSCDAAVLKAEWLEELMKNRNDHVEAVAYRGEKWQPMPAMFSASCLPVARELLRTDKRSMQWLLDSLVTVRLPMPDDWPECWQVNRPGDLDRLINEAENGGSNG